MSARIQKLLSQLNEAFWLLPGLMVLGAILAALGFVAVDRSDTSALGPQRISSSDSEFATRQLVEVAVRALSPSINDPYTAISVLDRLGAVLCDLVPVYLPNGVSVREGKAVLVVPSVDYDGMVDAMFHMIRQNARANVAVLIRLLEVLTAVATAEHEPARRSALRRHADLVLGDAIRDVANPADLADIQKRRGAFAAVCSAVRRPSDELAPQSRSMSERIPAAGT